LAYADTPPPFFDPFKGVGQNFPAAWRIKNHRLRDTQFEHLSIAELEKERERV
jgi:hypothetical protein